MSEAIISEKLEETSKLKNIGLWALQIAVAGMFVMAGSAKLSGDPMMIATFEKIGVGQWFRQLTGGLEVVGGVGLLTPFASGLAALGLALVMVGAVASHLVILGGSAMPAVVLLIASAGIAWGRRSQLIALMRSVK